MILALVLAAAMQFFAQDKTPGTEYLYSKIIESDSASVKRYVTIDNIVIVGNEITKSEIILRELDIKKGQIVDYKDLLQQLEQDQERVNNLRLFNTVKLVPIDIEEDRVLILIEVTERWYIFPVPLFDLVDRNFNVWWEQQDRDLSRVNYGLKLYQYNFRGRNEKLKLLVQFGFTRKFGINYSIPYLDKAQKHGLIIDTDYSENKNIAVRTTEHIQEFFGMEEVLRSSFEAGLTYIFRNNYQNFHYVGLKYKSTWIADTIVSLNDDYFRYGDNRQRFFQAAYTFVRDKRDVQAYPLQGYHIEAGISQQGLGIYNDISKTAVNFKYSRYFDLNKNWYFSNYSSAYLSSPDRQPYFNYFAVGYKKDVVRGYELYLVEGPHFFINKSTLKKRLFSVRETIGAMPIRQFRHFPLDVYVKTYADWGYVRNYADYELERHNLRFSDSYLFGTGVGLDLHTMYDMVIRLEYSVNKDMEHGFFFHLKREF